MDLVDGDRYYVELDVVKVDQGGGPSTGMVVSWSYHGRIMVGNVRCGCVQRSTMLLW